MKFRQAEQKKGIKEVVAQDDIKEMEEQYENMIYEKEENQIQNDSDMNAQLEEIKRVEATIMALEKRITEVQRENKMLDYDLARNNANIAQPQSVTSKVSTMNLNRINNRNSTIGGKLASITPGSLSINPRSGNNRNLQINSKPGTVSASVDLTGRLGGNRFNTL